MIYAVDIDGVLCTITERHYNECKPNVSVVSKVNQLFDSGHTIKIFTARGSRSGVDWKAYTEKQLADWGVKYHELIMGKPHADVFVDDKAIESFDRLKSTTLVMVVGKRGAGKSATCELFRRRGFSYICNESYYLSYSQKFPDRRVNQDDEVMDSIYYDLEKELIHQLLGSNVVYEATGTNSRWHELHDRLLQLYPTRVVKVSSVHDRYPPDSSKAYYPSTPERLESIKRAVEKLEADYEITNDSTTQELSVQVEGVVQKLSGNKLVATSGAFDPYPHEGHRQYLKDAKKLGNVVVILRNDASVIQKKGRIYTPEQIRKEQLEDLRCVDAAVISVDEDQTSNRTLRLLRPDIYAKSVDRRGRSEADTCRRIGCEIVQLGGEKIQSSRWLVEKWKQV